MALLLRLLFFVILFTLFRYLLRALLRGASRVRRTPTTPPSPRPGVPKVQSGRVLRDPLCGTFVAEELSFKARVREQTLHFCSEDCRTSYLAALEQPQRSQAR